MSSVEQTVRQNILTFPEMFSNRTEVLVSTLCTLGNGYQWVNGEAVYVCGDYPKHWTPESYDKCFDDMVPSLPDYMRDRLKKDIGHEQRKAKCIAIVSEIDERVNLWDESKYGTRISAPWNPDTTIDSVLYPQDAGSLLMSMPQNVTDDWRDACVQVRTLVAKHGWKF